MTLQDAIHALYNTTTDARNQDVLLKAYRALTNGAAEDTVAPRVMLALQHNAVTYHAQVPAGPALTAIQDAARHAGAANTPVRADLEDLF